MKDFAVSFYVSKPWRKLSHRLRIESGGKCQECGEEDIPFELLIPHHTVTLTPENINNYEISLNPKLIKVICRKCHGKKHVDLLVRPPQKVYIVWGSPLSGKSTFVQENAEYGDVIVDVDSLWQMVSGMPRYTKPDELKYIVFDIHRHILQKIKERLGNWGDAWVIMSTPDFSEVKRKASELGAEILKVDSSRKDCIERAEERPDEWIGYVNDWWDAND